VPRDRAEAQISNRIEKGKALKEVRILSFDELQKAEDAYATWSEYNTEMLRRLFSSPELADQYSFFGGFAIGGRGELAYEVRDFHRAVDSKLQRLDSIKERLPLIPEKAGTGPAPTATGISSGRPASNRIFVVHGHDDGARESVARFLERLGLEPIILHERASGGRTLIEKLEHHGDVGFAVVLLTPDDVGGSGPADLESRARQNVVLELGYFLGRLGRSRVRALHKSPLDLPSDLLGVVYLPMDDRGGWRLTLARELKDAGYAIDLNAAV
jgi:predicted nucleotide-binding protein